MRIHRLLASAAVFVLACVAPAIACDDPFTLHEIPAGETLYARAADVDALKKAALPTLAYTVPSADGVTDESYFIWTAKAADGVRYFSVATVYTLETKTNSSVMIFNPSKNEDSSICSRITSAVADNGDPSRPILARENQRQCLSVVVASIHPKYGTLYQLSLDRTNPDFDQHDERRIFIMHDPAQGWRFVGQIVGNKLQDSEACSIIHCQRDIQTSVTWTGVPKAPVKITGTVQAEFQKSLGAPIRTVPLTKISGTFTLGGSLPVRQLSCSYQLTVKKGDTLDELCDRLCYFHGFNDSFSEIRKAVVSLNAGLAPDMIRVGQKLEIPDMFAPLPDLRAASARPH